MKITDKPLALTNTNPAKPNNFSVIFDHIPVLAEHVQAITLPGVSVPSQPIDGPMNSQIQVSGSKPLYNALTLQYTMDEKFIIYEELYRWMMQTQTVEDPTARSDIELLEERLHNRRLRNITESTTLNDYKHPLTILLRTSSNKVFAKIICEGCLITDMPDGDLDLSTGENDDIRMTTNLVFDYWHFERVKEHNPIT